MPEQQVVDGGLHRRLVGEVHRSDTVALDHVLGYTCLNDVTARDLQNKDGQWTRAKGFDTFAPLGPGKSSASIVLPRAIGPGLRPSSTLMKFSCCAI